MKIIFTLLAMFVSLPAFAENCVFSTIEDWSSSASGVKRLQHIQVENKADCINEAQNEADSHYTELGGVNINANASVYVTYTFTDVASESLAWGTVFGKDLVSEEDREQMRESTK